MVTFTYATNPIKPLILILPNPQLRDKEILELKTVIDRSMNGTIWAFKDSNITTKFELPFAHVNRPKMLEVINFLTVAAGETVKYTDMDNNAYNVVILTQPFEETHVGRSNNNFTLLIQVYQDLFVPSI